MDQKYKSIRVRARAHREITIEAAKRGISAMDFVDEILKSHRNSGKHGNKKATVNA